MSGKKGMKTGHPIGNKQNEEQVKKKLERPAFHGPNPRTMTAVSGYDKHSPNKEDTLLTVGDVFNDLKVYAIDSSEAKDTRNADVYGEPSGFIRIPAGVRLGIGHVKGKSNWWVVGEKLSRKGHYFAKQVKVMSKNVNPDTVCGGDMNLIRDDDDD